MSRIVPATALACALMPACRAIQRSQDRHNYVVTCMNNEIGKSEEQCRADFEEAPSVEYSPDGRTPEERREHRREVGRKVGLGIAIAMGADPPQRSSGAGATSNADASGGTPAPSGPTTSSRILIFGGKGNDVFLGCLSCSEYDRDSVLNQYGDHGSKYATPSVHNPYGDFGSAYASTSACNEYASDPPVIVDSAGSFYGYLTVNPYNAKRVTDETVLAWLAAVCGAR